MIYFAHTHSYLSAAEANRRRDIQRQLMTFLGDELYWSYESFQEDVPLIEYGIDIILARTLSTWLKGEYGLDLGFKDIQEGMTTKLLVDKIMATET